MTFLWSLLSHIASAIGNIVLAVVLFALVWWGGSHLLGWAIDGTRAVWRRILAFSQKTL